MHIKVEVTMYLRLQVKATVNIFTDTMFDKERNSFNWTLFIRKTEESKLFYLMEVAWNLAAYLLSLLIANRNTFGYFMKLKRYSFNHTCKPVRTSNLSALA